MIRGLYLVDRRRRTVDEEVGLLRKAMDVDLQPMIFDNVIPTVGSDDGDGILGVETAFLAGSTDIPLYEVPRLVTRWGGTAVPSHIDRPSFSLLGVLGLWDPDLGFTAAELSHRCPPELARRPDLAGLKLLTCSDAHYLDQVWGAEHTLDLPECTPQEVVRYLACRPGVG